MSSVALMPGPYFRFSHHSRNHFLAKKSVSFENCLSSKIWLQRDKRIQTLLRLIGGTTFMSPLQTLFSRVFSTIGLYADGCMPILSRTYERPSHRKLRLSTFEIINLASKNSSKQLASDLPTIVKCCTNLHSTLSITIHYP
eukprot:Rmarinus@m.11045